jgi:outer membrane murein-binding lipoprotein Lpp
MRTRLMVIAAIGAAVLLAGCGAKPDDGSKVASISGPSSSAPAEAADNKSDDDKMREFAKCMRDHGIDMPDPKPSGDGGGMAITLGGGEGVDRTKIDAAQNACKHLMPNGGEMKPPSPEELDKMRKDAKCMRDHGIDMPDPDPTGKGATRMGSPGEDPSKFEAAAKACGIGMSTHAEKAAPTT